jgi:hypothetical protein
MSRSGFDYSSFLRYRNNFNKMYQQFDSWLNTFLLNEGMRFIAGVKPRTPVDTGDLRNHWQLDGITRSGDTLHCWFVNTMNYATFVEYGHAKPYKAGATEGSADWVPGYFMMTVTLDQIERSMPARFDSAFRQFLLGLGVM